MADRPLVSILITSYNREKYIRECLDSVINQSYANLEIIVSDNCSTDNTVAIVREYLGDCRIKLYQNASNIGQFPNRNMAASYATGKYLKYVDSDDIIYPFGTEIMVNAMEKFGSAGAGVFTNTTQDALPFPYLMQPEEAFRQYFFSGDALGMGPSGVIFKTDVFNHYKGFTDHSISGDVFLLQSIALKYPIVKIGPPQFWWRRHEAQENEGAVNKYIVSLYKINNRILRDEAFPLSKNEKDRLLTGASRMMLKNVWKHNFKKFHFGRGISVLRECLVK